MLWLMCFQVYFKPSYRCIERELESSAKTKVSTPLHWITHPSPSLRATLQLWYNLHSYFVNQRGRNWLQGLIFHSKYPFLAIHAKGEKVLAQSKRTAPPPLFLKEFFKLVSYCVQKGEKVAPSKIDILKPSWTLKEEFIEGEFCLSQRKSIWNRGRKFQILKMPFKILFIYLWLFSKGLWKGFTKEFAKTKHMVQEWSKMLNIKKQSMRILWVFILAQF
jgi:hypothetical protein